MESIALKTPAKGLSDGGDLVRQHGLQGQVLAITNKHSQADRNGKLLIAD